MAETRITLIPGDGIGPEVTAAATQVVDAVCPDIQWETFPIGQPACNECGAFVPEGLLESVRRNQAALKGPATTPVGCGFRSVNVELRKKLELYAGVRPAIKRAGIPCRFESVDLVVIRENTEGLYAGIEHELLPGVVETIKVTTERASRRIADFAFRYAETHGRHKVTCLHKANIMKLTDGVFLEAARQAAAEHPDIEFEDILLDAGTMRLVQDPATFDVLLTDSLVGDVLSDLAAGLVGGLGLAPGANVGHACAVFEAVHGAAPDIAGTGRANPLALIISGAMMLRYIGRTEGADRIDRAVDDLLIDRAVLTPDLGGSATTAEVVETLCQHLEE